LTRSDRLVYSRAAGTIVHFTPREDWLFMVKRTLSIIKPDGVSRNLIGQILARLEKAQLKVVALKMIKLSKEQAKGFYKVHEGKPFYESLTGFMSSGPCVVMILEGEEAIERYRALMGATDYRKAAEGTIRRDYATDIEKNVVHGSDSDATAAIEMEYFFNALEVVG
jgi:nucleoside-diphosphate kinase